MAEVRFRTNVLLKSIIGKDLITDDNIAVLELVKNAFDANSKSVDIIFENLLLNDDADIKDAPTQQTSKILIRDFGNGMSSLDITDKWLNIAYSEKKEKREEFGRQMAGNKGVGRFSCDRLGEYLNIYTRQKGTPTILHLFIDWRKFEIEGKIGLNIQDIILETNEIATYEFESITGRKVFEHGTLLEISKLREAWPAAKLIALRRQLEKLINPNQAFKTNTFDINIIANDYSAYDKLPKTEVKVNGAVVNRIFDHLDFKTSNIESTIDTVGKTIKTELKHKGNVVFTLLEHNNYSLLKDIKISVYYLSTYSKIYFAKQTGIRSVDFGSISLFINGFRIPPYGDQNNDWLGMEARKGQGFSRYLSTRETVGRIEINDTEDQFKIISNRSGVVNDEVFSQLIESRSPYGFFFKTFRRLERFVAEGIKFDSVPESQERKIEDDVKRAGDKWSEEDEVYTEDSLTKNKRILSIINNIIDHRQSSVISLEINDDFINEIIKEQVEASTRDLDKIVSDVTNKDLRPNDISSLITKLEYKLQELDQFSDSVTERTGADVRVHDQRFEQLRQLYEQKQQELSRDKAALEKRLAEEEAAKKLIEEKAAAEKKRLEDELEAERKENLFSKKLAGADITAIVGLQHHIDRATDKIHTQIDNLIDGIENGAAKATLLKYISKIDLENKMIASIVQFVTSANYNLQATEITKDLNRFIREYVLNVYSEYRFVKRGGSLNIDVVSDKIPFNLKFKPLEIIIIIDNLFSNSRRAKSHNIEISLESINDHFVFRFADDGSGMLESVIPRIYNLGFTTTEGSGIGLYHIKQIVERLKGKIDVDNQREQGVEFIITIPKS